MKRGGAVLRKIVWQIEPVPIKAALPEDWKTPIQTKPLLRNMTLGKDDERCTAWAKAMARKLEENPRVTYADASLRKHGDRAAVVVTFIDRLIVSASLRTKDPAIAEKVAAALALIQPSVDTVVTDSNTAYGSFRRWVISFTARAILSKCKPTRIAVEIMWVPAHSQLAGNTITGYHAREMSLWAEHEPEELPHPVTSFRDIIQMYREGWCRVLETHPDLTRKQQAILRQAEAGWLRIPYC
ncbi:hypothetical protein HPB51_000680 [Rhipicephalus microplus]|uniref:Tick transposon n=1 Tax=Rhipicephalus microplus TaxID=6941 RepID=A0A9J6EQQ3_RHIMP|nr:hypothetical protein HPB51_000680 [Rhipicephalus microplus]